MNEKNEAAARRIYFTGALAAVDRQIEDLQNERERLLFECDQAKKDLAGRLENDKP